MSAYSFLIDGICNFGAMALNEWQSSQEQLGATRDDIQESLKPTIEKKGIRKEIVILEANSSHFIFTNGNTINCIGKRALIVIPNYVYEADPEAILFALKHELVHIEKNDAIFKPVIRGICSIGLFYFASSLPWYVNIPLFLAHNFFHEILLRYPMECRADSGARIDATNEELLGGRRLFKAMLMLNDRRFSDMAHPPTKSRIAKIEDILAKRNVSIPEGEDEKIKNLSEWLVAPLNLMPKSFMDEFNIWRRAGENYANKRN